MQKTFSLTIIFLLFYSGLIFAQKKTSTIQIDGKSQHYQLTGIDDRKLGQPLVIIEGDLGSNLESWQRVINELQENTPVLTYDRAGLGQSEAVEEIPTPANRTKQLKHLLDELELAPPYILVGDGWGAILIKDFAQTYPKDVEAMIYIDPMDQSSSKKTMIAVLDGEGLEGEKITTSYFEMKRDRFQNAPAGVLDEAEAMWNLAMNTSMDSKLYDFPEVPSVIFVGGKQAEFMGNLMDSTLGYNYQEVMNILQKNRIADFTEQTLASTNFEMILTSEYANYMQIQISEKIGSAIMQAYFGNPAQRIVAASQRYTSEEFEEFLDGTLSYYSERKIPEATINMLGYDQLRRDQPEHAMILFQHNLVRYPESANVYDSMGDGLVALGKSKEAVSYFEKAVELGEKSKHSDLGLFKKNLASAKEGN